MIPTWLVACIVISAACNVLLVALEVMRPIPGAVTCTVTVLPTPGQCAALAEAVGDAEPAVVVVQET